MCLACIKCDDDALMLEIDFDMADSLNFHERPAQLANALIAIFAFGGNLDRFQNCVIGPFRIERIGWVRIVWSCRVHCFLTFSLTNVRHPPNGRLVHAAILDEVEGSR